MGESSRRHHLSRISDDWRQRPQRCFSLGSSQCRPFRAWPLLARCSELLREDLGAIRVYDCRYGHEPGHTVHYHVIPVYDWTVRLFEADTTCRKLQMFYPGMADCEEFPPYTNPDGCDMTLFICRRFAERGVQPPTIYTPSVGEVVEVLRKRFTTVGR